MSHSEDLTEISPTNYSFKGCILLSYCPQAFDAFIYIFFALEMVVKMVALGIFGRRCYLGDTWNRLDFFIVMAGWVTVPLALLLLVVFCSFVGSTVFLLFFPCEEIPNFHIPLRFCNIFFFPPLLCLCIGSFQARTPMNVNWIPSPGLCSGKCKDPPTWHCCMVSRGRMEAGASLLCISYQSGENSSRCSPSVLPGAASVVW